MMTNENEEGGEYDENYSGSFPVDLLPPELLPKGVAGRGTIRFFFYLSLRAKFLIFSYFSFFPLLSVACFKQVPPIREGQQSI